LPGEVKQIDGYGEREPCAARRCSPPATPCCGAGD